MKLCECGCGRPTPIAKRTGRGYKKGEAMRFVRCHRLRRATYYYKQVGRHDLLHRIRAEQALGHALPLGAVVHHLDGSKHDDAPIAILQNRGEHQRLHARMRVHAAGGNPWTGKICARCHVVKPQGEFYRTTRSHDGRFWYCKECSRRETADPVVKARRRDQDHQRWLNRLDKSLSGSQTAGDFHGR